MKKRNKKRGFIILFGVCVGILVLLSVVFVVFQGPVKRKLLSTVSRLLPGEIEAANVHVAPFEFYPYLAVRFDSVTFHERSAELRSENDIPLFHLKELYVGFHYADFFKEELLVGGFILNDGIINLRVHSDSSFNFINGLGIKPPPADGPRRKKSPIASLDVIEMSNVELRYFSALDSFEAVVQIESWNDYLNMPDMPDSIDVSTKASLFLKSVGGKEKLLTGVPITLDLAADYEEVMLESHYHPNSRVTIGKLNLGVEGRLKLRRGLTYDFIFSIDRKGLGKVNVNDPNTWVDEGDGKGSVFFHGNVSGGAGIETFIESTFNVKDLDLINPMSGPGIERLNIDGAYTTGREPDGSDGFIKLNQFNALVNNDSVYGLLQVENFNEPEVVLIADSELNLRGLDQVLGLTFLNKLSGDVKISADVSGSLDFASGDFFSADDIININFNNVGFELPKMDYAITDLDGKLGFKQNRLRFQELNVKSVASQYDFNAEMRNILYYIFGKSVPLEGSISLRASQPDFYKLLDNPTLARELDQLGISNLEFDASFKTNTDKLSFVDSIPRGTIRIDHLAAQVEHGPDIKSVTGALTIDTQMELVPGRQRPLYRSRTGVDNLRIVTEVSDLSLDGELIDITDDLNNWDSDFPITADLTVSAEKLNFEDLFSFDPVLSAEFGEEIRNLKAQLSFASTFHGLYGYEHFPEGRFRLEELHGELKNAAPVKTVTLDLEFAEDTLRLHELNGYIGSSEFHAAARIENFTGFFDPDGDGDVGIWLKLNSPRLKCDDLFRYGDRFYLPDQYRNKIAEDFNMELAVNFRSKDLYDDQNIPDMQLAVYNLRGKINQPALQYDDIRLFFHKEGDRYEISTFEGEIGSASFELTALLRDFKPFTESDLHAMKAEVLLKADTVDLNELLGVSEKKKEKQPFNPFDMAYYGIDFDLIIDRFTYDHFELNKLQGKVKSSPSKKVSIEEVTFESADGQVTLSASLDASNPELALLTGDVYIDDLNIQKVMLGFVHDEDQLDHKSNFRGQFSAHIQPVVYLDPQLNVDLSSSRAVLDFKLAQGEIIDFEPVMNLQKFFDKQDVSRVRLGDLQNTITLDSGKLIIPRMDISSTLGQLYFEGDHQFDSQVYYTFEIPFRLVAKVGWNALVNRSRKEGAPEDEIQEARKGVYVNLRMVGNTEEGYQVKLGKGKEKRRRERSGS